MTHGRTQFIVKDGTFVTGGRLTAAAVLVFTDNMGNKVKIKIRYLVTIWSRSSSNEIHPGNCIDLQ